MQVLFVVMRSKSPLFGSDGLKDTRQRISEDMHSDCITPTMKHPVSVIWSCMTSKIQAKFVINRNINAQKYTKEILKLKLKLSTHDLQDKKAFIFQQDSILCHVACVWKSGFKIIILLYWNRNSPGINPI